MLTSRCSAFDFRSAATRSVKERAERGSDGPVEVPYAHAAVVADGENLARRIRDRR